MINRDLFYVLSAFSLENVPGHVLRMHYLNFNRLLSLMIITIRNYGIRQPQRMVLECQLPLWQLD